MPFEPIIWGIALAATAGLRLFMPFLFVGAVGRYGNMPTPDMLAWTATDAGILLLLIATLLEVLGDKIPIVDHALDVTATFLKPAAGLLLPAALLYDFSPMGAWTIGIVRGRTARTRSAHHEGRHACTEQCDDCHCGQPRVELPGRCACRVDPDLHDARARHRCVDCDIACSGGDQGVARDATTIQAEAFRLSVVRIQR